MTNIVMRPTGSPDTGWTPTGPGVLRNSQNDNVLERRVYYRFESTENFAPPYTWTGKIRTISLMSPPIFADGTPAWYKPGLVFHPMYGSSTTAAAGNDENVLFGLGTYDQPAGHVGISAELRAERPATPYGVRTGYVSRERGVCPTQFWDGQWHNFRVDVLSHSHYRLYWDGVLMADVVEKLPATMAGKNRVGLRCDFTDIEICDFAVIENSTAAQPPPAPAPKPEVLPVSTDYRIVPRTEIGLPGVVTNSSGGLRPPLYLERYLTAHYTGNNVTYRNKVTPEVVRQIQAIFSATKPFEYNYVIGQEDDDLIYEFAGLFQAAHSAGENGEAVGVLFLLGVGEEITPRMIDKWHWLRDTLIMARGLRLVPDQRPHHDMPDAATQCAGPSVDRHWPTMVGPRSQLFAPKPPAPITTPTPPEDDDMNPAPIAFIRLDGQDATFAQYKGFKTWVPDIPTLNTMRFFYPTVPVHILPKDQTAVMSSAGPILGTIPPRTDGFGRPA